MNSEFILTNFEKAKVSGSWWPGLFLVTAFVMVAPIEANAQENKISELGRYEGYSEPVYSGWVRTSQYVTVRDGTKLAVDIIRPKQNGVLVEEPLPVIWTHTRYQRATVAPNGDILTVLGSERWLHTLLRYGYVVAAVDVRGGGASYGTRNGPFAPEEAQDAYDITEWFAAQSWSNGKIGMYGGSYLGITQYFAASTAPPHLVAIFPEVAMFGTAPPHLVAIFPEVAMFDVYSFVYSGGVFHHDHFSNWENTIRMDTNPINPTAPVDEDIDGAMLREAQAEHQGNTNVDTLVSGPNYRDSLSNDGEMIYFTRNPAAYLEQIKQSGVAAYHLSGWYDVWPKDALLWFNNLDPNNPQKIVIGPWNHSRRDGLDLAAEHLRWYDFWLKDVDNGIMDEAPIHYYTMGAPEDQAWRQAWQWPLPEEESTNYYFLAGPSGSVASVNDGLLGLEAPTNPNSRDDVIVNYGTTTGRATRWTNAYGGGFGYPDMTPNNQKGLTYTTPPLEKDIELTGHPVVHLWVTSTAADGDFFVYLEEVEESGGANPSFHSNYITEGTLRASHRAISTPPYEKLGLPYHRSFAEDITELPTGEPVELVFDLHPTSNIFDKGHRIRVTITFADRDNTQTPILSPAPTVSVYRNPDYVSYITLPVIPPPSNAFEPSPEDGATINDTWVLLGWQSGEYASSHDVYFGDNYEEVNEGSEQVYRGNQTHTWFFVGISGYTYPEGLVPGTTYYWRIDEVDDTHPNSPWKGPVWSFTVPPYEAYDPVPADGSDSVEPDVVFRWTAGPVK
jgi:putative CocE/NonD family hydrolase